MYEYKVILIRPSADVAFYENPAAISAYIKANYKDTGLMETTTEPSEDPVIQITHIQFTTEEDFNRFKKDPIIAKNIADRKAYEAENNIVRFKDRAS